MLKYNKGNEDAMQTESYKECHNRDLNNVIDTAEWKGRMVGLEEEMAKGRAEEKIAIARNLKSLGFSVEKIAEVTELSEEEIDLYCR